MAEQIILSFFWCSLASVALVAWTSQSTFFQSILSIILEFISIFKIFGIALLALISLGIAIVLWEQVISQTVLYKKLSLTTTKSIPHQNHHTDSNDYQESNLDQSSSAQDQQPRSILPILILIVGLAILALIDTSFLLPSSSPQPLKQPSHLNKLEYNQNTSVFQFFSAILTLAIVVAFIVFNKDEYRAWKARRRLSKHLKRRARLEHSLINSSPPK